MTITLSTDDSGEYRANLLAGTESLNLHISHALGRKYCKGKYQQNKYNSPLYIWSM